MNVHSNFIRNEHWLAKLIAVNLHNYLEQSYKTWTFHDSFWDYIHRESKWPTLYCWHDKLSIEMHLHLLKFKFSWSCIIYQYVNVKCLTTGGSWISANPNQSILAENPNLEPNMKRIVMGRWTDVNRCLHLLTHPIKNTDSTTSKLQHINNECNIYTGELYDICTNIGTVSSYSSASLTVFISKLVWFTKWLALRNTYCFLYMHTM